MSNPLIEGKDLAAIITPRTFVTGNNVTAAGTGDATTKTGISIDRHAFGQGNAPTAALFAIGFAATLASGATLSVAFNLLDSADDSAFTAFSSAAAAIVGTGPSGGGAVIYHAAFNVNMKGARRYVRCDYVPDMSAGGTDTAILGAGIVALGGFSEPPAPA